MYNSHAARAYQQTRRAVVTGRDLESMLPLKAAAQLQAVRDDWANRQADLLPALTYNRKLWTVLIDLILKPNNPLPQEDKNNLFNIALFVFQHTVAIQAEPKPDDIAPLVDLNRTIAEGLRS